MKDLLVVTTLFDYFGSKYMRPNFEKFKAGVEREGVDLVVYEAAVEDQPFRLQPGPNVFQLRSRDMIWQKERMVNLAIDRFADEYRNVAWIDNDIVLQEGWSRRLLDALDRYPVAQLFSEIDYQLEDGSIEKKVPGYMKKLMARDYKTLLDPSQIGNPGTAWAARTSVLKGVGIYDAYINCGSDTLWSISIGGERRGWVIKLKKTRELYNVLMNHGLCGHHGEWHQKFTRRLADVSGHDVRLWATYVNETATHLYHGRLSDRNYMLRYFILWDDGFDPETDLKLNDDGLYEWASEKPRMHKRLRKIFLHGGRSISYI